MSLKDFLLWAVLCGAVLVTYIGVMQLLLHH